MNRPKVVIFNCASLDGRMDAGVGQADMGLYYQLASRWNADAMLSGSNTLLAAFAGPAEPPPPTPTGEDGDDAKELHPLAVPYLVIVDSRGRIHNWAQIRAQPFWRRVIVLCARLTPPSYREELARHGVACIVAGERRVDLRRALEGLSAKYGIRTLRVDSGGTLNGALLRAGLVDEVSLLIAPLLVGGESPQSIFVAPDVSSPEQAIPLRLTHFEPVGEGRLWLRYQVSH
ncbi:MAG: RibD family protein [Anaerolineales bacterium]|jgi:2,5-diamino-6-(ribosylamino)-4(3H)-pyrimidinone 5'-phosphate reductase